MGTPAYMSPEQINGETASIGPASDQCSLGASLFLKLTGRYPFERDNVVDVLHAVIHDEPPMLRSLRASVPRSLRHEINNPLNTLYTSLEQLEQIPDSSGPDLAAADYLARARRALGKIRLLTDKLAEAANLEQALAV